MAHRAELEAAAGRKNSPEVLLSTLSDDLLLQVFGRTAVGTAPRAVTVTAALVCLFRDTLDLPFAPDKLQLAASSTAAATCQNSPLTSKTYTAS